MKKIYSLIIIKLIISIIPVSIKMIIALSLVMFLTFCPDFFPLSAQGWSQVGMDIDGEAAGDLSGTSVSFNTAGNRMAIGAYGNDGNGTIAGHVRVYEQTGGVWTQLGGDINGEINGDESGIAVSMSGDGLRVVIGAHYNDGNGFSAGHVRVYKLSGGTWIQQGPDIDGEAPDDFSGWSVATNFDGKRLAIGAPGNNGNGTGAGHVRVYKQTGNNWIKVGADIDGEAADDGAGFSVSLSDDGTLVAIGARYNDGNGIDAGQVRVYKEINGAWTQVGIDIDGEGPGDFFGHSVSLSDDGNRLAIGAPRNDGNGADAGHVRVYENIDDAWTQVGLDIDSESAGDHNGSSVSLSSDGLRVAIGAGRNDAGGNDAGHVRVYEYISQIWTQVGGDIDGEAAEDVSGGSTTSVSGKISLSGAGDRVAIGAPGNDDNGIYAGHVRVYGEIPCDFDLDGYDNAICEGQDCNDNNASINPYATELCNGVDDNCDGQVDEGTTDADGDGICDALDNCSNVANTDQADSDGDGIGNICDTCPNDPNNDIDGDGVCGDVDNCPYTANSGQGDSDCDTVGDNCDVCPNGDDSVDNNNDGIADCSQLLNYSAYSSAWQCGTNKIYVCHSGVTQCISKNQLSTHYNHGDNVGACISCPQNMTIPRGTHSDVTSDGISPMTFQGENVFTELEDITQIKQLNVYPNPVKEILQVSYKGAIDEIRLISAQGLEIRSYKTDTDLREISVELLPNGIYILMIRIGGSWTTKKFIKF